MQVWNRQAEDLWGLREDETVGQHFLNLDIGLPAEQLKPVIRDVVSGSSPNAELKLDAINRRGRAVMLRVTVTPLMSATDAPERHAAADGTDRTELATWCGCPELRRPTLRGARAPAHDRLVPGPAVRI